MTRQRRLSALAFSQIPTVIRVETTPQLTVPCRPIHDWVALLRRALGQCQSQVSTREEGMGGDLGTVPPKFEVGDGPCIRPPPNILIITVIGCEAKYEQTKKLKKEFRRNLG